MKEFLYVFGYEDPINYEVNNRFGTDYESSNLIKIVADSEIQAKQWGDNIAEEFIKFLFRKEGMNEVSWKNDRYAGWIEKKPDEHTLQYWEQILIVKVGEYPDFEELENTYLN